MNFDKGPRTALEAQAAAQWIAFAPFVFQCARVLRDTGILQLLEKNAVTGGLTLAEVAARAKLSEYGARVLLEGGLGIGVVKLKDDRYATTKTAYFLMHDPITRANLDFTQDVNYQGLFNLEDSIREGKPLGLAVHGPWKTLYEALAHFTPKVRESWLAFDHIYSDAAFPDALPHVFRRKPATLLDIGGNTGKFTLQCLRHDPDVRVTIVDLPGQLNMARATLGQAGLLDRVTLHEANLLDPASRLPAGLDAIWMSQFLDCFSEDEVVSILRRCREVLAPGGYVYVLETFWDRQRHDSGAFSLQMTSLYFTALANGNSRMYETGTFGTLIRKAGLRVVEQTDHLGTGHTLLACQPE
jgi:ubiquinone/menaquinone biosynthesis C-methylase UbiE